MKRVCVVAIVLTIITLIIGTSRPAGVARRVPTVYICEGTTMVDGEQAIYDATQCK